MAGIAISKITHLIFNPAAGRLRKHPERLERAAAILRESGHHLTLRPTAGPHDATRLAREAVREGAQCIAVAGGDGTINEVLNGIVGAPVELAPLPGGTANVLCRELGLGTNIERAASALAACVLTPVSVGLVETAAGERRHFLCMAGVGLDAAVVHRVNPRVKRWLGKGAYFTAAMTLLGERLPLFDGNGCYSFLLAARVRNYGGDLAIALGAGLRRADFEVVAIEGESPFRYIKYFLGVLTHTLPRMSGVAVSAAAEIELKPRGAAVYIQVDGEEAGQLPARIAIVPNGVRLLMPPSY